VALCAWLKPDMAPATPEARLAAWLPVHREALQAAEDALRSFIGGRRAGDRCLYVSTGGFTREARYEAERSSIPVMLIALPELRELVTQHYEAVDATTRSLVPLRRMYWPVD